MSTKPPKRPRDPNQLAKLVVDIATGEAEDAQAPRMSDMARIAQAGGFRGGIARAEKLTREQRAEIAKNAAAARWQRKRGGSE